MTKVLFPILLCCKIVAGQVRCIGEEGVGCCEGYMWNNETKNCIKCQSGYIGSSCEIKCPFPTYGELCQGKCNCIKNSCHFAMGCISDISSTGKVNNYNMLTTGNQIKEIYITAVSNDKSPNQINEQIDNSAAPNDKDKTQTDESTKSLLFILVSINSVVVLVVIVYICKRILTKTDHLSVPKSPNVAESVCSTAECPERNVAYHVDTDRQYDTVDTISSEQTADIRSLESKGISQETFLEDVSIENIEETGLYLIPLATNTTY